VLIVVGLKAFHIMDSQMFVAMNFISISDRRLGEDSGIVPEKFQNPIHSPFAGVHPGE
jgi:hypothetical protein